MGKKNKGSVSVAGAPSSAGARRYEGHTPEVARALLKLKTAGDGFRKLAKDADAMEKRLRAQADRATRDTTLEPVLRDFAGQRQIFAAACADAAKACDTLAKEAKLGPSTLQAIEACSEHVGKVQKSLKKQAAQVAEQLGLK